MNEVGIFELSKQINYFSLLRSEPGKQGSNRKTLKCSPILLSSSPFLLTSPFFALTFPNTTIAIYWNLIFYSYLPGNTLRAPLYNRGAYRSTLFVRATTTVVKKGKEFIKKFHDFLRNNDSLRTLFLSEVLKEKKRYVVVDQQKGWDWRALNPTEWLSNLQLREKEVRIACVKQSTHNGKKEDQTPQ